MGAAEGGQTGLPLGKGCSFGVKGLEWIWTDVAFSVDKSLLPLTPHLLLPHRADPSCLPSLLYAHGWRMLDRQPLTKLPNLPKFRTISLIGTLAVLLPRSLALSSHPCLPHCGFYTFPIAMTSSPSCVGKLWGAPSNTSVP